MSQYKRQPWRNLTYWRAHPAVARQVYQDRDDFQQPPSVRGHPLLTTVTPIRFHEEIGDETPHLALVKALSSRPFSVPREFAEGDPRGSIRMFFNYLGDLWTESLKPDGNWALKEPAGLTVAAMNALWASAMAAGVPPQHPAYATMLAIQFGLQTAFATNPKKFAANKIRSFAVSFVQQGQEAIQVGERARLTKDQVRVLILPAIMRHCNQLLPKGGIRSIEGLQDWERGHDVASPNLMNFRLPPLSREQFADHVDGTFNTLAHIFGPYCVTGFRS